MVQHRYVFVFVFLLLLREPTGVFSFSFEEFEASCKARNALKYVSSLIRNLRMTVIRIDGVFVRHSVQLCKP